MEIQFKDFIDYDKYIGKILVFGVEGSGKTLLLTRIAIGKMLHGYEDCMKSYKQTDYYNSLGLHLAKNYDHCCFSNYDIKCLNTYMPDRRSYSVDPFRLGFFRDDYETDFYPPETLFVITEGYNYFNSYMYNRYHPSFISYCKTSRQARISWVVDSQELGDFCTKFRQICNRFIYLEKKTEEIKDSKGQIIGHKLFVVEWTDRRDVDVFESCAKRQNYKEYTLILDMCVYGCYDTEYCKFLHIKGRENQQYRIEHFPTIKSIADIENSNILNFTPPEGFFSSNSKINKSKSDDNFDDIEEDF